MCAGVFSTSGFEVVFEFFEKPEININKYKFKIKYKFHLQIIQKAKESNRHW